MRWSSALRGPASPHSVSVAATPSHSRWKGFDMNTMLTQIRRAAAVEVLTSLPARRAFAVTTFVLLTAFSAHVSAPLPGTAVPVSLQTLMVLLSGMLLGPALGAAAQTAYLAAGAAGLPVFTAGLGVPYLFGPTGGYLLAFPAA